MSTIPSIPQTNLEDIGLGAAQTPGKANNDSADFLNLFVAQLRNQNPLEPQEGAEFLSQLAQFSTVEGIKNMESSFSQLAESLQSNQALQASSMVGRKVEVHANQATFSQGEAIRGSIEVPSSVTDLTLEFVNQQGEVVKTMQLGSAKEGYQSFNWNGLDDNDTALNDGVYQLRAYATVEGERTNFATLVAANVDSVTMGKNGQSLVLNVAGHGPVTIDKVRTIS